MNRDLRGGGPRVVLHVGAPKSGTTFLQRSLWARRAELEAEAVRCVGERARDMFHAAIEVRGKEKFWNLEPGLYAGAWQRLCEEARSSEGTAVMSHELLAPATPGQVAQALAPLAGVELHLVFTARDLGRQIPSDWQERIKNGATVSFGAFQHDISERFRSGQTDTSFWRAHDVVDVLDRWGRDLPPQRIHVVVAPPAGSPPEVLWRRFAAAVGFDGERIPPRAEDAPANQALGAVQVELLRAVNLALGGRIPQPHYARFVKRYFAQGLLAKQTSARARCTPQLIEQLHQLALDTNREIEARGYRVHGDLSELLPEVADEAAADPDAVEAEARAAAATEAIADLLLARVAERGDRSGGNRSGAGRGKAFGARRPGSRLRARLRRVPHGWRRA